MRSRSTVSVFEQFRAFWSEVESLRTDALAPAAAPPGADASAALVHTPAAARQRLVSMLRAQEADVSRWATGPALQYQREAQYVMAAAADDLFVRLPWSGAAYWEANLLELERFGTRSAGQTVFTRVDQLLMEANPEKRDLAAVYLTALALGFRGRYGDRDDGGEIERYRRRLYEFIFEKSPDLTEPLRKIVPACYDSTVDAGAGRRLRSPRTWWWVTAGIVALWLVVAQVLWTSLASPLRARVHAIVGDSGHMELHP
jgi:type VI secretion system protein ImpK